MIRSVVAAIVVILVTIGAIYPHDKQILLKNVVHSHQDYHSNINRMYIENGRCFMVAMHLIIGSLACIAG